MKKEEEEIPVIHDLPHFPIHLIACVYVGKPYKCMCGCSGTYYYTKINQKRASKIRGYAIDDNEVNDKKVKSVLDKMIQHAHLGIEVIEGYIYTLILGKTQYTLYLLEKI